MTCGHPMRTLGTQHSIRARQKYVAIHVPGWLIILHFLYQHFAGRTLFIRVQVHGTPVGGDADELRLLSTSDTFINLRAHGGSLDFLSTKVPYACRTTHCPGSTHNPIMFTQLELRTRSVSSGLSFAALWFERTYSIARKLSARRI